MNLIERAKEFITHIDTQRFYRYSIAFFSFLIVLIMALMYYYFATRSALLKKIDMLNNSRTNIQELLTRSAIAKKQKEQVEKLLRRDKTFYIGKYFSDLLKELTISPQKVNQQEPVTTNPEDDYSQVKLITSISDINMKQLTELLDKIEQEERIYIEELDIMKTPKASTIDINIVVATLEPKPLPTE